MGLQYNRIKQFARISPHGGAWLEFKGNRAFAAGSGKGKIECLERYTLYGPADNTTLPYLNCYHHVSIDFKFILYLVWLDLYKIESYSRQSCANPNAVMKYCSFFI